jgi:hypothetical protein
MGGMGFGVRGDAVQRSAPGRVTRVPRSCLVVMVGAVLVGGCSETVGSSPPPSPSPSAAAVNPGQLNASVTQDRFGEGTRNLLAGVTNNSQREIRVDSATIRWPGLDFPTVRIDDPLIPAGQTAAFTITFGTPHCNAGPATAPVMQARINGRSLQLPLHVDVPGLLGRLHDKACAEERLDALASVALRLARGTTVVDGTEVTPGEVVVHRRPGATGTVTVEDLGGSVLFDVLAREGRRVLPARLGAGDAELRLPVVIASTDRCDGHARSQSSQTFLFSIYVRRDQAATQRVIAVPSTDEQVRLLAMLDRVCG